MRGLAGRRFLVAGGASGIGEATARRLAEEGALVVIADRNAAAAARIAGDLGTTAEWMVYEQSDAESVVDLFRQVSDAGPLHGVALVAGVHLGSIALADITPTAFAHVHGVNVQGVLRVLQLAVDTVVVDVRNPGELAGGMITGAVNIPLARLLDQDRKSVV